MKSMFSIQDRVYTIWPLPFLDRALCQSTQNDVEEQINHFNSQPYFRNLHQKFATSKTHNNHVNSQPQAEFAPKVCDLKNSQQSRQLITPTVQLR